MNDTIPCAVNDSNVNGGGLRPAATTPAAPSPEIASTALPGALQVSLPTVVAEWPKSDGNVVRVTLDNYRGAPMVAARLWYTDKATGELKPGLAGLTLSIRHLPALAAALGEALAVARAGGLLPEGGGQ